MKMKRSSSRDEVFDSFASQAIRRFSRQEDCQSSVISPFDENPCSIDASRMHKLQETSYKTEMIFVDGGNSEILKAPNISISFMRTAYSRYKGKDKISSHRYDYLVSIAATSKEGQLAYEAEILPMEGGKKRKMVFDPAGSADERRSSISSFNDVIRRILELELAASLARDAGPGSIVVIDGGLDAVHDSEKAYLDRFFSSGDVLVCGLCKTTTILTDDGDSAVAKVSRLAGDGRWYYDTGLGRTLGLRMFFAKLHPSSRHIFRLDVRDEKNADMDRVISSLSSISSDPVFPGYPYGLLLADRLARVENREAEYLRTRLLANHGEFLRPYLSSLDAHEILDNVY